MWSSWYISVDGWEIKIHSSIRGMIACDYMWMQSCRYQKQQACVLETLGQAADNLTGVVEKFKLCGLDIELVESNKTHMIQVMRRLLSREVAELLTPQAHFWNETMDEPDL
jgi:hypothetical protein